MNDYFQLSIEDKQRVLQQTSARLGLSPQAIEKDLWVTTILQIVFTLPFADKLIFKGGTSFSKVWHQIDRFSEDIDLAVDRALFGMEGDLTKKQINLAAFTQRLKKSHRENNHFFFLKLIYLVCYNYGSCCRHALQDSRTL